MNASKNLAKKPSATADAAANSLLLEVDEAMRWERIERIWKNYGNYILGGMLAIILGTAALSGYNAWSHHVKIKNTEHVISLLQDPAFPGNITPENLKDAGALKTLALIQAASAEINANKPAEAQALLEQVTHQTAHSDLHDLAVLMQVRMAVNNPADKTDLAALRADLESIAARSASPWQAYAALEAASLYANLDNDPAKAQALLKPLLTKDNLIPSLRAKAEALNQLYAARMENAQKNAQEDAQVKTETTSPATTGADDETGR